MTPDPPKPPPSGASPSGDDVDFAALVEQQNSAASSKQSSGRKDHASDSSYSSGRGAEGGRSSAAVSDGRANSGAAKVQSRWWRIGYPLVVGAFIVLIVPALVFAGLRVILDSSDGQLVKRVTNPEAPGYEAVVEKTPTAVAAIVAPDGSLDSAVVFALTSDSSGGVLLIPAALGIPTDFGMIPLSELWKGGALESVASGVGEVLNLNFNEKISIPVADWATLVGPYAPLSFTIPDAVRDPKDAVVFPKGTVTLTAAQVATFLTSKSPKDNELNRTLRQELFWKAWLAKVKSAAATFPTPITSGIGRFVASVARGQLSVSSLPVVPVSGGSPFPGGGPMYIGQPNAVLDAVAAIVPFPDGAPGGRPRIRVLDGTGKLGNGVTAAIMLNAAGGQVDVVGNAKSFGQDTTQIIYFDGTSEATAQKMRAALTMGEIIESKQSNSGADMTVILGEDFLREFGPTSGGTSLGSSSSTVSDSAPTTAGK